MRGKRFCPNLFDRNDDLARTTLEYLKDFFGIDEFKDTENKYTIDRAGWRNGNHVLNVEVEIKQHWKEGHRPFPFLEINLPIRKIKYVGLELPTFFVIFSADCKGAIVFSDRMVEKAPKEEVPNRYVSRGEYFFKIPIENAAVLTL